MNSYTDMLREHNLKATPQRLAITNILHAEGHINIDSLYERMIKQFSSISLATIYKNIHLMIENSFIQEVKIPNAKSVYELSKESHSHLVCSTCKNILDITLDLNTQISRAVEISNFKIDKTDLVLSGVCEKCQKLS